MNWLSFGSKSKKNRHSSYTVNIEKNEINMQEKQEANIKWLCNLNKNILR